MAIYELRAFCVVVAVCSCISTIAADDVVVGPMTRIDPGTSIVRFAHEYAATARGSEVVAIWMKEPAEDEFTNTTFRRAYSSDYGVTWTLDDLHEPDEGLNWQEYDPCATYDPVSKSLYVGGFGGGGGKKNFVARRAELPEDWSDPVEAWANIGNGVHLPKIAAGPIPGFSTEERLYLATGYGMIWSDDLGATWTDKEDRIQLSLMAHSLRVTTNNGYIYQGGISGGDVILERSVALEDPMDSSSDPEFLDQSIVATITTSVNGNKIPSTFRVPSLATMAASPADEDSVYFVWPEVTSETEEIKDVNLYFSMADDATDSSLSGPDWSTPMILPAGEAVAGDQFFPWLEATSFVDGPATKTRLHLLFMDGRHNPDQEDQGSNGEQSALFDYYYAYSEDEGATWTEIRLTDTSFDVEDGIIDLGGDFYGDYLGMVAIGKRVYTFFTIPAGNPSKAEAHTFLIVFGEEGDHTDMTAVQGTITVGDDTTPLESSDDYRLVIEHSGGVQHKTILDVEYTITSNDAWQIDIVVEAQASKNNASGKVLLKNVNTSAYDEVGTFTPGHNTDTIFQNRGFPDADAYVDTTNDIVTVRLEMTASTSGPGDKLESKYDLVQLIVVEED